MCSSDLELLLPWSVLAEDLRTRVAVEEVRSRHENNLAKHTEMRLCGALLDVASDLEQRARLNFIAETGIAIGIDNRSVRTIAET